MIPSKCLTLVHGMCPDCLPTGMEASAYECRSFLVFSLELYTYSFHAKVIVI